MVHIWTYTVHPSLMLTLKVEALIPCRGSVALPLQCNYTGGVSVFRFRYDATVVIGDGQETVLKLGPVSRRPLSVVGG